MKGEHTRERDCGKKEELYYIGFEEDARMWGLQTSAGMTVGLMIGWIKGLKDSAHLAGTYGQGSVYHGKFAVVRVPANILHATLHSASWGWRVGIFSSCFSVLNIYLDRKKDLVLARSGDAASQSANSVNSSTLSALLPLHIGGVDLIQRIMPSAAAGAVVGGSFGLLRQGGIRGSALGSMLGLGLGGGLKGLEVVVETLVKRIEEEEKAKKQ